MNIIELRNKTAAARASKDAALDAEFKASLLRKYIDQLIQKAADNGEGKLILNFYYAKERVFSERYGGPTMAAAVRHYRSEGFDALSEGTNIIISWM